MSPPNAPKTEWWLDLGAGIDAEHWSATPASPGVRRIAMDPLLTSGMVESGRLAVLPPDIRRVGAELRPENSVEAGKQPSLLPFADDAFSRVHCGFVLHLYLEVLDLLAEEAHRVLKLGGELTVLVPHFGDARSEGIVRSTIEALRRRFGEPRLAPFEGPFTSFWADLYRNKTLLINCRKEQMASVRSSP
jgi:SAM-dependent methyltransferase